ncbi:MAG: 50S ribosomal protein L9 [Candidatus Shikimatogenerans bostrichidophilus]|nr:MAG: 50S ribosomal protein L9 [Candidatus Shikimatogenerans bostrichidophilus]
MIKIILKKKIKKIGLKNEIKLVKLGYAFNYLIPKNYAVIATKFEIKKNKEIINKKINKKKNLIKKYNKYIKILNKKKIIFYIKKKGKKYFNLITKKNIKKKLEEYNIFIKEKNIILNKKIFNIGDYKIIINLKYEKKIYFKIKVLEK